MHMTRPGLRPLAGLWRIWFDIGATQQYYPLVHSAFWILFRLFGGETLGYHVVTIVLHAVSACLLGLILRRLAVPGAMLAAVIFALHPVHVESVAWMTELKNTLSGVFYLAAALAYLRFDESRRKNLYAAAVLCFVLALLSKSVTATLPVAMLVVIWWRRGTLEWRRDVMPVVPLVLIGTAAGLMTAWFERAVIGARGADFQFTVVERFLVAGRAIWFYAAKLVWPANLMFMYPRWQISQQVWWQYLYPLSAGAAIAASWWWRRRSRAPFAAALFFVVTLAPALGFVDVYPFLFSFVADHFQYLASIGIITLVSAAAAGFAQRASNRPGRVMVALTAGVGVVLGVLTWQQSRQYVSAETLYRETITRNPECWLAHTNLAAILLLGPPAQIEESILHTEEALRLKPDYAPAQHNLGAALENLGRFEEAVAQYRVALQKNPAELPAEAHHCLGRALQKLGKLDEAIAEEREAVRIGPATSEMLNDLGIALGQSSRPSEALEQFEAALRLNPDDPLARTNAGSALLQLGRAEEALAQHQAAVRLVPSKADFHYNLGVTLEVMGRLREAAGEFQEALRLDPAIDPARSHLERIRQAELGGGIQK